MPHASKYFVYILHSQSANKFYIGHTNDLNLRFKKHNSIDSTGSKFTNKNGPWTLVYSEEYLSRSEAMKREKEIKSKKSRKYIEYLINQ